RRAMSVSRVCRPGRWGAVVCYFALDPADTHSSENDALIGGRHRIRHPNSRSPTGDVSAGGALGPLPAPPLVRSSCGSPNLMAATHRLSRLASRDNVRVALVARNPRDYIPER